MAHREEGKMVLTDFGWALISKVPKRKDLFWVPEGTKEVWTFADDELGWVRIKPPLETPCKELHHG